MTLDLDVWLMLCSREYFDLDVWLMLCSREYFSFRNDYIQTQMIQEIPMRNVVLRRYCKIKGKTAFSKFVSAFPAAYSNVFNNYFVLSFISVTKHPLQYGFGFRISSKMFFTSAGRHGSTNVVIDHS